MRVTKWKRCVCGPRAGLKRVLGQGSGMGEEDLVGVRFEQERQQDWKSAEGKEGQGNGDGEKGEMENEGFMIDKMLRK